MGNSNTILIVEDSSVQSLNEQLLLEKLGKNVLVTHTANDAFDLVKKHKPSIVISDIILPEIDGYKLCSFIKDNEETKDIPVILLASSPDNTNVIHGLSVGADDYIIKPYDTESLLSNIKSLIERSKNNNNKPEEGSIDLFYEGKDYVIKSTRRQISQFLISTYDNIRHKSKEHEKDQKELKDINEQYKTRLKELELSRETLKGTEEQFRTIVQMIPDIVYLIDEAGHFKFINNAIQILGYSPIELIGKHFKTILTEEDANKYSRDEIINKFNKDSISNNTPKKIFDERRRGDRTTLDLELHLIPKYYSQSLTCKAKNIDDETIIVEVDCAGLYEPNRVDKNNNFIGTVGIVRDITTRKQTEDKLAHLASFPQINVNPILELDSNGAITFNNKASYNILSKLNCQNDLTLFLPHDIADILKKLRQKEETQLYREVEIKDQVFAENIHLVPEFNVVRIYTNNITDSKKNEELIRKLSIAIEQSPSAAVITDINGIIEYVNPKFYKLTGYSKEEVIGKTPKFLKSGEQSAEVFEHLWQTITSGNKWDGEFHYKKKNGELYWEHASVSPIKNEKGEIINFIKIAEDITTRKLTEQKLLKSERRFAGILDLADEAVISIDESMQIILFNKSAENIFGYTNNEIIGQPITTLIPKKYQSKHEEKIKNFARSNIYSKRMYATKYELYGERKNGEEFPAEASISQLNEEIGKIFTIMLRDITEQKNAEKKLIKYQMKLESLVSERTKELKNTYERLIHSEKLSAVGKLSASVAHEFNNPIFGIRNVLEIIKSTATNNKDILDFSDMAITECDRMALLIEKLRDLHSPSTGRKSFIQINKAIDDTLLLSQTKLKIKKIKIEKQYDDDLPKIKVVLNQIKQVILNMISNAEQAITDPKGGLITVKTETIVPNIKIEIHDNGCGISTKDLESIFDPFFSTKSIKGTGLGLSVSNTIIQEHGGTISVISKVNEGTTFTITLPLEN